LTKLVNENKIDWDEHLFIVLFSYKTTYKITIKYTPYQLVYGLDPLMSTNNIVLVASGNEKNSSLVKVLTNKITKLEKLKEARM
jgi:hypothetical protein